MIGISIRIVAVGSNLDAIYAYRMEMGPLPFVATYLLILMTAVATIVTQMRTVVLANPAEFMRTVSTGVPLIRRALTSGRSVAGHYFPAGLRSNQIHGNHA